MKALLILVLTLVMLSCGTDGPEKPNHLIKEDEMVDILYDLSLLQAINSSSPKDLEDHKVDVNKYIYKKYKIDSATFAQNHKFYASDLDKYKTIHTQVAERLKAQKAPLDSLAKKEAKTVVGRKKRVPAPIPARP